MDINIRNAKQKMEIDRDIDHLTKNIHNVNEMYQDQSLKMVCSRTTFLNMIDRFESKKSQNSISI